MAMSPNLNNREQDKFRESPSGKTQVAVTSDPDSPLYVSFEASANADIISEYDETLAVPASTLSTIISYTTPVAKTLYLQLIEVDGTNIAEYHVLIDSVVRAKKHTWFNGKGLSEEFPFAYTNAKGLKVEAGSVIDVKVQHERPFTGDFSARILGILEA